MIKFISNKLVKIASVIALTGLSSYTEAQTFTWDQAGPIYSAGRMRCMIVDKSDPSGNTLYAGSTTSGVFKSTNGGTNWLALNSTVTDRVVSYMAQGADNTIYVATGEGFLRPNEKVKAQKGSGLYKINGNGLLQIADETKTGTVITKVACSPTNPNLVVIAGPKGILKSTDGGQNFTTAGNFSTTTHAIGQDLKFDSNGILYCTFGSEYTHSAASATLIYPDTKIYKSTDNNLNSFTDITPPAMGAVQTLDFGRIELAVAPSNPNVIYASCAFKLAVSGADSLTANRNSTATKGFYVTYNGGTTWALISVGSSQLDALTNGGTIASGDRAHCLTVSPTNSDAVFIGGYKFYIWQRTNGSDSNPVGSWNALGQSFLSNFQNYIHENIHDIKLLSPTTAFFVTDAGIYKTSDSFFSFQPFYQGIVTGQFNNVSIERYPIGNIPSTPNSSVTPYSGFIGSTSNAGLNYFSGNYPNVTLENSFFSGEVNASELSKILPGVAYASTSDGKLYLNSDIKTATFAQKNVDKRVISSAGLITSQSVGPFSNAGTGVTGNTGYGISGTPFKMWENYGQIANTPDSLIFYNDTLRLLASIVGIPTLTTQTTFSWSAPRPNKFALIDSIVVRTGTVLIPASPANSPAFTGNDLKQIHFSFSKTYTVPPASPTQTTPINLPIINTVAYQGAAYTQSIATINNTVTLNQATLNDEIKVTFASPPFANKTATSSAVDNSSYYRVFCVVFYRYKAGDVVQEVDNSISTKTATYTATLPQALTWSYGSTLPSFTMAASNPSTVINPTFVATANSLPNGINNGSNPTFTLSPIVNTSYTASTYGSYTLAAKPVTHTINAVPAGTASIANPTYVLTPGNFTQTTVVFTVTPTTTTNYTITETGTGTLSASFTYSTINASTYSLSPGSVSQASSIFTVVVTPTTALTAYTITGVSSNTVTGVSTTSVSATLPVRTFSTIGGGTTPPRPKNNPVVKTATSLSSRLAFAGAFDRIYVSTQPLALNDVFAYVCVSGTGAYKCDALGNKTTTQMTVVGKPTILEWSKTGLELYYATDANNIYRVNFLHTLIDSTARNYNGKLESGIFKVNTGATPLPTSNNPTSPYRTTLIGSFTKPITSISIAENNTVMAVTFNDPTGSQVKISGGDITKVDDTGSNFTDASGSVLPTLGLKVNCSLIEKTPPYKKAFIGTDAGLYFTNDITLGTGTQWSKTVNQNLPDAQIFDIKQQTLKPFECYNSGQIYVATNGRGVWQTKAFYSPLVIGVTENSAINKAENNLSIYPNPTSGEAFVNFNAIDGETATINVMDITGKVVLTQHLGKLYNGEAKVAVDVSSLNTGLYIVDVNSTSGIKRVAKLVVTK